MASEEDVSMCDTHCHTHTHNKARHGNTLTHSQALAHSHAHSHTLTHTQAHAVLLHSLPCSRQPFLSCLFCSFLFFFFSFSSRVFYLCIVRVCVWMCVSVCV